MANKELLINSDLSPEQKALGLIMCVGQEKQAEISRLLKPLDISYTQLSLLHALDKADGTELTVKQLKSVMIDDSPNVSRALNKLVDKGHIVKRRCTNDQRTVFVSITGSGKEIHLNGDKLLTDINLNISPDQASTIISIMSKI